MRVEETFALKRDQTIGGKDKRGKSKR